MKLSQLRSRCRPHLWYQLYWVVYLIWFFWLDLTVTAPKYIIHSPLDDLIPFNEWFVLPYCSWFLLLAGVTAALWWCDTASYDKLCLTRRMAGNSCGMTYSFYNKIQFILLYRRCSNCASGWNVL